MRAALLIAAFALIACSGRAPPAISIFDSGVFAAHDVPAVDVPPIMMVPDGGEVPEFELPDLNPASSTQGMTLSPRTLRPKVVAYYFANAVCGFCGNQAGVLDTMQRRFNALTPPAPIQVVMVNEIGGETGMAMLLRDRTIAFVQDNTVARVWAGWGASRYQLWLVDGMGRRVEVLNLANMPLTEPNNAMQVQTRLLSLAGL